MSAYQAKLREIFLNFAKFIFMAIHNLKPTLKIHVFCHTMGKLWAMNIR